MGLEFFKCPVQAVALKGPSVMRPRLDVGSQKGAEIKLNGGTVQARLLKV